MDKQELRDMYIKETGDLFLNNIAKYADWLEEKVIFDNTVMNKKLCFLCGSDLQVQYRCNICNDYSHPRNV